MEEIRGQQTSHDFWRATKFQSATKATLHHRVTAYIIIGPNYI